MELLDKYSDLSEQLTLVKEYGVVSRYIGMVIEVKGLKASIGEYCRILNNKRKKPLIAEVVGFRDKSLLLMPFDKARGISMGDLVESTKEGAQINFNEDILGKTVDPFCNFLGETERTIGNSILNIYPEPGNPLEKEKITEQLETGIKALDYFLPLGKGQRVGLFAGSGIGKTTLIRMLTRNVKADIKIVVLIGERGREVAEFIESLNTSQNKDFIVVAAAADQPPLTRAHAIYTATALAEYYCEQNKDVLLIVDSITRFAMAQREIGLAIGEPPTSKGYTPSVFSQIPLLLERVGNYKNKGSITGVYTVLVEGGDFDEPVSDHMRAILDGHIILSREIAEEGVYPSIDILKSKSRIAEQVVNEEQLSNSMRLIKQYSKYRSIQDLVELGAYEKGKNIENDRILDCKELLSDFISQKSNEVFSTAESVLLVNDLLKKL